MVGFVSECYAGKSCFLLFLLVAIAGSAFHMKVSSATSPRYCTSFLCKTVVGTNSNPDELEPLSGFLSLNGTKPSSFKTFLNKRLRIRGFHGGRQKKRFFWEGYVPVRESDVFNDGDVLAHPSGTMDSLPFATASSALRQSPSSSASLSSLEDSTSFLGSMKSSDRYWCIAKPWADQELLQAALDWACGLGGADCSFIQLAQPCFVPNDLLSHASYAFNSYFHIHEQELSACDFAGTAMITNLDPSYPGCNYPFRLGQVGAPTSSSKLRRVKAMGWILSVTSLLLVLFC
ncbi:hypothetical protein KP509_03G019400 [Ceratopteris richardii]|uniref:X8 domain-containing protein n=1 Tax=Ceratopteris richardii TaxID=49495 RepID=A0A8T2V1I1_CERRI|nr:hypothetical protein KP509_03G019400 [Ceratopteris richardii]